MEKARLEKILSGFEKTKVLVIGDLMLDEFIRGTVSRISPEAPVPVVKVEKSSFAPGGACNVVNNIYALKGGIYLCGIIGQDETGDILLSELSNKGIDTKGIIRDNTRPTTKKVRIIAHQQQVVRVDIEEDAPIKSSKIDKIIEYVKGKLEDVDAVIIEDYGKGLIQPLLIREVMRETKRHKKIIVIDPKEEHFSYYKGATIITPNHHEAEVASGIKIKDDKSLNKAGARLLKRLDCEAILMTLGEKGMVLFEKEKQPVLISTVAREVFDVSGAGDTVVAALTMAKTSGANTGEAAYISNIAGAVVVGKLGVAVVTQDEIRREFATVMIRSMRKI